MVKPPQVKSSEIKEKMMEAEETEKEIEARSNEYRPVAKRASLLYFCLADLAVVSRCSLCLLGLFFSFWSRKLPNLPRATHIKLQSTKLPASSSIVKPGVEKTLFPCYYIWDTVHVASSVPCMKM